MHFGKILASFFKPLLVLMLVFMVAVPAFADEVEDLQRQIQELEHLKKMSEDATKPLEQEYLTLEKKIGSARAGIAKAKKDVESLSLSIAQREKDLAVQYSIFSRRVAQQYKKARHSSNLQSVLASEDAVLLAKDVMYRAAVRTQDNQVLHGIGNELVQLERDRQEVQRKQETLAQLDAQLSVQAEFFKKEIDKARAYQTDLSGKIASLSAQQKAILAARSGSFTTSVGDVPVSGDIDATIAGFRQNAPSGSFAVFSFGAFTHRKGMSQYGAKARAESGQSFKEILAAYYGKEPTTKDTGGDISVSGVGSVNFEEYYLYGIAEMPSSWHPEALKAQAVAARTYAFRYKEQGKAICITEACQVFSASKAANAPEAWKQAVRDTRGQVIDGVTTYYSATSGGYSTTSGWDTTDKSGSGAWTSRAWESKANSPWFYRAWYRQAYSDSSSSCGRKPWLSEEEMADIINAWLVRKDPRGADTGRIVPVTIRSCGVGGQSGDPYSMAELRGFVDNPVTSIQGTPVVQHSGDAQTTVVKFQTNRGEISISGSEFKETFNTRAPGYLSIPQTGFSFFNIERK